MCPSPSCLRSVLLRSGFPGSLLSPQPLPWGSPPCRPNPCAPLSSPVYLSARHTLICRAASGQPLLRGAERRAAQAGKGSSQATGERLLFARHSVRFCDGEVILGQSRSSVDIRAHSTGGKTEPQRGKGPAPPCATHKSHLAEEKAWK